MLGWFAHSKVRVSVIWMTAVMYDSVHVKVQIVWSQSLSVCSCHGVSGRTEFRYPVVLNELADEGVSLRDVPEELRRLEVDLGTTRHDD